MTLIVRVYGAEKKARDAAKKLKTEGFGDNSIFVMASAGDVAVAAPKDPSGDVAAAVKAGQLPKNFAGTAVANLKKGRSIVSVDAPFGHGPKAAEILDSFGPLKTEEATATAAAPRLMSESLGIPLLWNGTSFLSTMFGGLLSSSKPQVKLIDEPAPLSKRIGMDTLQETPKDWTKSLGQPLLSEKRFITGEPELMSKKYICGEPDLQSKKFIAGEPELSSDPAPFSKKMGWTVLTK